MDTDLISWPAPAKLNLFLHITGRREDGYHDLQSVFQLLDYGDTLSFEPTLNPDIVIHSNCDDIPVEENIIYKAALLLQKYAKCQQGCNIWLNKVLPMGGGLGGGSSNAATTLVALNYLWGLKLNKETLQKLGLSLGADVPIFIFGHSAFAEGVGELLKPIFLPNKYYLVVHPGVHISTAKIFSHPNLTRDTAKISMENYEFSETRNDCQSLVCDMYPDIAKTLSWLLEYAPTRMTGTGSCLFSIYDDESAALDTLKKLPKGCQGFVSKGTNHSPLLQTLELKLKK